MDTRFRLGEWQVQPRLGRLSGPEGEVHLQPKAMQVLVCLARRSPDLVTKEELFRDVWQGVFVSDEALTYVIWELRKALGDDAKRPRFIETVPKKGYRLIASPCFEEGAVTGDGRPSAPGKRTRGVGPLLGAFGLTCGVGLSLWFWSRNERAPTVHFQERDWVLIADFENRTGEAHFDGSLQSALERELLESAFVNVAPRKRIEDVLLLMRRPPETRIDPALAREVALRDGAIRAILGGRIEKDASGYLVTVRLVDSQSGATLANPSVRARTEEEILLSFRRLSDRIRVGLRDDAPADPERHLTLQRVTTRSLSALQLFSQAMVFVNEDKWSPASEFFERAVSEDPEFASAHIWLAHAWSNLGNGEAARHYERAFALAEGLPDRERYFILGSHYARHVGDDEKAVQAFEILTELDPEDYWAAHKLANAYSRLGRDREAGACRLRLADLRPESFQANIEATFYLFKVEGRRVTDTRYFERARALATPETAMRFPSEVAELELLPAQEFWIEGNLPRTLEELDRVARLAESPGSAVALRPYLAEYVGRHYLSLGMIRAAETRFRAVPDEERRNYLLAQVALARGDENAFRGYARGVDIARHLRTHWMDATAVALTGDTGVSYPGRVEEVARALETMQGVSLPDPLRGWVRDFSTAARGELHLARGRVGEAIPLLEQSVDQLRRRPRPVYFLAVESLASAWERRGNRERARQVLAEAARHKSFAFDDGLYWMRVQIRLAEINRRLGRLGEAQEIENELRRLLVHADRDHEILREVERAAERTAVKVAVGVSP